MPLVYELWHIKLKWLNYEWNHFTHFTYVDVRQNPAIVADFGGIFSEHKGDPLTIGAGRVKLDNSTYPRYSEVYAKSMTIYYEQYTISYVVSFEAEIGGNVSLISATVTVKSNYETKVEYELFHQAYYYDISYTKNKYIYITNMPTNITFPITLQTPLCSFNDDVIIYEQRTILVSPAIWMFLFWYISDKPLSDR